MENSTCHPSPTTVYAFGKIYFATYNIIMPIYFFIGLIGHAILLVAFWRQAKTEQAYFYQIFVVVSKLLDSFIFSTFVMSRELWCKFEAEGVEWFRKSYFLNFYTAYIGFPLGNVCQTVSLLASVFMSADRMSAMLNVMKYKNRNHRAYRFMSVITSVLIGISISSFEGFGFYVQHDEKGDWMLGVDFAIFNRETMIGKIKGQLFQLRSFMRLVALITLIAFNVILVIKFRARSKKIATMSNNHEKEKTRKAAEKSLVQLTVCQSLLTCVTHIPHLAFYLAEASVENWMAVGCWGRLSASAVDAILAICETMEFFVVLLVNQKIRGMVFGMLPEVC